MKRSVYRQWVKENSSVKMCNDKTFEIVIWMQNNIWDLSPTVVCTNLKRVMKRTSVENRVSDCKKWKMFEVPGMQIWTQNIACGISRKAMNANSDELTVTTCRKKTVLKNRNSKIWKYLYSERPSWPNSNFIAYSESSKVLTDVKNTLRRLRIPVTA